MNTLSMILTQLFGITLPAEINVQNLHLGLVDSSRENTLTFLDNKKYVKSLIKNSNISVVFVTPELSDHLNANLTKIQPIVCEDPRYNFYTLYNYISQKNYVKRNTVIDESAIVHSKAYISEYNVIIGKNVIIEPNVSILADVIIGDNCIIRAGTVIGSEGFEYKRTSKGILPVFHDGKVIIGSNVEIGANCCIDKGLLFRDTIIADNTKLDNLVHIAHCVHVGESCLIAASAMIAGSVTIKNNVWIGPRASISNNILIGNHSFITIGSVVTKDVQDNQQVTGNFAIPHDKFLNNLRKSLRGL